MTRSGFEVATHLHHGAASMVMRGELDAAAGPALDAAYTEASAHGAPRIVLDFAGVDYINSTGIALIVGVLGRARQEKREVAACGLTDHYREIFDITRLSDFMTIYPDEASAVGGVPAPTA